MTRMQAVISGALAVTLSAAVPGAAHAAQQSPAPPHPAAVITGSGLLPVYGADVPIAGVEPAWERLAAAGINVIRFTADVRDTAAAERTAALCVWARGAGVKLLPVLTGADPGEPVGEGFPHQAAAFVTMVAWRLKAAEPSSLDAYGQLFAYQIGRRMNDAGRYSGMPPEVAQARVLQAARAIRELETQVLKDTGVDVTPLLAEASFDAELVKAGLQAPAALGDADYAAAYTPLSAFVSGLAASADIDLIGVDYRPGSVGAGDTAGFAPLLRDLTLAIPGKRIVLSTGTPGDVGSGEQQQQFYALAFANLADYRVSDGAESPFLGVILDDALEEPAQEALAEIAEAVTEAGADVPADAPPDAGADVDAGEEGSALAAGVKDRVQQFLFGLLDRSLERLSNGILSTGHADPSYDSAGGSAPADDAHADPAGPDGPDVAVKTVDVSPAAPVAKKPVTFSVAIASAGPAELLTVALVDGNGALLATKGGVSVPPGITQVVDVTWTPKMPGAYTIAAVVADANLVEIASSASTDVAVAAPLYEIAPDTPGQKPAAVDISHLARLPFGLPLVMKVTAGDLGGLVIGRRASAVVSLTNPYTRALRNTSLTLSLDGAAIETRTITMLPGQTRTIVVALPHIAQPGEHELRVALASAGAAPREGSVTTRIRAVAAAPPSRAPEPPAATRMPDRPAVTRQPEGAAPPTVRAPEPPAVTRTPERAAPPPRRRPPPPPQTVGRPAPPAVRAPRAAAPDLAITGIAVSPRQPTAGQVIAVRVSVRNAGAGPSQPAVVSCAAGRTEARATLPALAPRQQRDAICRLRAPATARFAIGVSVGAANDANLSNNRASITVTAVQRRGGR